MNIKNKHSISGLLGAFLFSVICPAAALSEPITLQEQWLVSPDHKELATLAESLDPKERARLSEEYAPVGAAFMMMLAGIGLLANPADENPNTTFCAGVCCLYLSSMLLLKNILNKAHCCYTCIRPV